MLSRIRHLTKRPLLLLCCVFSGNTLFAQSAEVTALLKELNTSPADTTKINILNSLGKEYVNTSDYNKSLSYAGLALKLEDSLLISIQNKTVLSASEKLTLSTLKKCKAESYNNIGNVNADKGDYARSLDFYFKSLKLREECFDTRGMAASYNNIGLIYYSENNFDQALEFYFKSLKNYGLINNKKGMAMCYNNIGVIYKKKSNYDKALEFYEKSLRIKQETGSKKGMGDSYNNIAIIYHAKGNYKKALEFYTKSLGIDEEIGNKKGMAVSHNNIGNLYLKLKNPGQAKSEAQESLQLAMEIGSKDDVKHAYRSLAAADSAAANYKSAFENHKLYVNIKDSIFNEESNKKIVQAEMNFEFAKKEAIAKAEQEKKDALSKEELHRQTMQRNGFVGGFALMVALAGVSYNSYRNKKKAHTIIEQQKQLVEEKNKDITDSINYAKNIQQAILPFDSRISETLNNYFILFKPRDIVSGDFYWFTEKDNFIFIAVADCTGHGVPGAFMSMIGSATLTHAVSERGILLPGEILSETNKKIKEALKQSENNNRDGMDISLLRFEKNNLKNVQFAGSMRTFYHINTKLNDIPGNKMAIGGTTPDDFEYTNHVLTLNTGDMLYMSSDGYADQFGGDDGKKFRTGNFKKLLFSAHNLPLHEQKILLDTTFESWKGSLEQLDDVCVVGVRI
ncbi:MAG: hypothetical protein JWO32_1307 [Bacteroidetes bacterium]|nr:hypothetical protein [Bacteroidota bacterium]